MVTQRLAASISLLSMTVAFPAITFPMPTANAEFCDYPAVGVSANVVAGRGAYCNYPTEINGSHLHCESGSFGFGGGGGGGLSIDGIGIGGASCTWRCPDNTLAPAPNPPGAWESYIVPQPNACADHMEPAGPLSEPVRPDEGIPPEGGFESAGPVELEPHGRAELELPGPVELQEIPDLAPGEPHALDPAVPEPLL